VINALLFRLQDRICDYDFLKMRKDEVAILENLDCRKKFDFTSVVSSIYPSSNYKSVFTKIVSIK